jgi:hypothetical protein
MFPALNSILIGVQQSTTRRSQAGPQSARVRIEVRLCTKWLGGFPAPSILFSAFLVALQRLNLHPVDAISSMERAGPGGAVVLGGNQENGGKTLCSDHPMESTDGRRKTTSTGSSTSGWIDWSNNEEQMGNFERKKLQFGGD